MKKLMKICVLIIALTICVLAAGETPISGVAGCAPGLWYPESQICCMPGDYCPAGR